MIYDNSLSGEEQIREYPDGDWKDIAKASHFYDVFLGAFESRSVGPAIHLNQYRRSSIGPAPQSGASGNKSRFPLSSVTEEACRA